MTARIPDPGRPSGYFAVLERTRPAPVDYEVAEAAKILSSDPAVGQRIGRDRLLDFMFAQGWIYRGRRNRWCAFKPQIDLGRLKYRAGGGYYHRASGQYRSTGTPAVLITDAGLAELRARLIAAAQGRPNPLP